MTEPSQSQQFDMTHFFDGTPDEAREKWRAYVDAALTKKGQGGVKFLAMMGERLIDRLIDSLAEAKAAEAKVSPKKG